MSSKLYILLGLQSATGCDAGKYSSHNEQLTLSSIAPLVLCLNSTKVIAYVSAQLNAQVSAHKLYENCGFVAVDKPYKVKLTGMAHA